MPSSRRTVAPEFSERSPRPARRPLRSARILLAIPLALVLLNACGWLAPAAPRPADAAPLPSQALADALLADFEPDAPAGFFVYNGGASSVTATTQSVPAGDPLALPGQTGANGLLAVDFSIGDFGGFGQDVSLAAPGGPQDWTDYHAIGFWFYGTGSGLGYQIEIADNRSDPAVDTAERFDLPFVDDTPGWRFLVFPFSAFTRATDFQPGGAPDDGFGLTEIWSWAVVLPGGADSVYFDDVQLLQADELAAFEPDAPAGFFVYNGGASSVTATTQSVPAGDPLALPGQTGANGLLAVDFSIGDFGGFGQDVSLAAPGGPQDWTDYHAIGFWFYGTGSGLGYQIEIADNRSDPAVDTAERFDLPFVDDTPGWRFLVFPFSAFTRATDFQPGGAPDDGFGLTEIWSWAVVLPGGADSVYFDDVQLLGAGEATLRVGFATREARVVEGDSAILTVALTTPAADEVRVDYASVDGSAAAGSDYDAVSGTLVFAPGDTEETITVATLGNDLEDGVRSFSVDLSAPVGAELGANAVATVTIIDDDGGVPADLAVVDDFEDGLPSGTDPNGIPIGFYTFSDGSPVSIATSDAPPAPVPGAAAGNTVLQLDANVTAFAGFVHGFENDTVDTWVTQDWSAYEGFGFWFYGAGSGAVVFVDVLDNRPPGSTRDDAERLSTDFRDDVPGWRFVKLPFSDFFHKEIGNGAPNDGFDLTTVHGWALGTLNTGGPRSFFIDDAGLYGTAPLKPLTVSFLGSETAVTEGDTAVVTVKLSRPLGDGPDDPDRVRVSVTSEPGSAEPERDYTPNSGTLTFVPGGPLEQTIDFATFDNSKRDYDRTVIVRLEDASGADTGLFAQSVVAILDDEILDPGLIDDMENGVFLWDADPGASVEAQLLRSGEPGAVPGQDRFETVLHAQLTLIAPLTVNGGDPCRERNGVVPVVLRDGPGFHTAEVDVDSVRFGGAAETHRDRNGRAQRHGGNGQLTFHFRAADLADACAAGEPTLTGTLYDGTPFGSEPSAIERDFALGRDWSAASGLSFWFRGNGDGTPVAVTLQDNRASDPGPNGWQLVWSDEFDGPAGTPPDPASWSYEIGDGAVNRIPGWGNDEFQYYTDDPANAAMDGAGNLVITAGEADGQPCYYGPCRYTSARLISQYKEEFAYGRIESRLLVPDSSFDRGVGLWPAFWSLGTDIAEVTWPQTGEIDFMEFVGRLPNEIFGTVHGPGYSGGQSYGNVYDFGTPVSNDYHTFTVEWQPDLIEWYVDGILYHTATPSDVPGPWVFNDPVFLLLNLAVGGNFGGAVGPDTVFPADYKVDYVRVYQGPDTAERFEATFVDDFVGWQRVSVPFSDFTRSAEQPAGAPDDGLTLTEMWGYGLRGSGAIQLDEVRLD